MFTLKFQLPDDNWDHDDLAERLGAAGCGDASIGAGCLGHIAIEFKQDAGSMVEAIEAAQADVMGALPTALLIEQNGSSVCQEQLAAKSGALLKKLGPKLAIQHHRNPLDYRNVRGGPAHTRPQKQRPRAFAHLHADC